VLVLLAAGKGTRFGTAPKCVQPVRSTPLARHSIDAFRRAAPAPCVVLVGHAHEEVMARLGGDNVYVRTANPTGGTAWAAYEALSVPGLLESDPLLVVTMGDRVIPDTIFRRLLDTHAAGPREADLTLLSAFYAPPAQHGKGRILRDASGAFCASSSRTTSTPSATLRSASGSRGWPKPTARSTPCARRTLHRLLGQLRNDNAQSQYYFTDLVEALVREGGEVRTLSTRPADPEYLLLCSDVTRPPDLARLESILAAAESTGPSADSVRAAAEVIAADRSAGQTASIAGQLRELARAAACEEAALDPERPVAIGISGGRFRIAFMHPDMGRFFGPAWQMPTGARDATGREQIVLLAQQAEDGKISHLPTQPAFREKLDAVPADDPAMYPPDDVDSVYKYEAFGTRMAEQLLLSLGYFSDAEIRARKEAGLPLPPHALWVSNSMRRPFSLICNAIASLRTLRDGPAGERIRRHLGRDGFRGLRLLSTAPFPRRLFQLLRAHRRSQERAQRAVRLRHPSRHPGAPRLPGRVRHRRARGLARPGDRAEGEARAGRSDLLQPRDNYRTLGVFLCRPSASASSSPTRSTATARRGAVGRHVRRRARVRCPDAARNPQADRQVGRAGGAPVRPAGRAGLLHADGGRPAAGRAARSGGAGPRVRHSAPAAAAGLARGAARTGRRNGRRTRRRRRVLRWLARPAAAARPAGRNSRRETGVPLRAMVAYLFVEVARCFRLIREPDRWIEHVTRSQRGDCCFEIDPANLRTLTP
jgi:hypothetical protein